MIAGEAFIRAGFLYNMLTLTPSVDEFNAGKQNIALNVKPAVVNEKVMPIVLIFKGVFSVLCRFVVQRFYQ